MQVKANVRQRRIDRMKQITDSQQPDHRSPNGRMPDEPPRIPLSPYGPTEPPSVRYDPRMEDPEYVWKQRDRYRYAQSDWRPEDSGPGGEDRLDSWLKPPTSRQIWGRLIICVILFGLTLGLFRWDHPLAWKGRQWVTSALTEDYNFAAVAAWYESKFSGLPSFLPAFRGSAREHQAQNAAATASRQLYAPVSGTVVDKFSPAGQGVTVETKPDAEVKALDAGRVISVASTPDRGTVIVVQHANGLYSMYGWIERSALKKYDWVKGGETIGAVTPDPEGRIGKLFFALKKDNQYINPTEVVSFD